jgi:hypothetical protein
MVLLPFGAVTVPVAQYAPGSHVTVELFPMTSGGFMVTLVEPELGATRLSPL